MRDEHYPQTVAELLQQMDEGMTAFLARIDQMSTAQLSKPTDAVGWTIKDHLAHLAVWADGINALLRKEDRWAAMGLAIDEPTSDDMDYDTVNAQIKAQHSTRSAADIRAWFAAAHRRLAATVASMSDADLQRPYGNFSRDQPSDKGNPIVESIIGNSYEHYPEHLDRIEAIAARA